MTSSSTTSTADARVLACGLTTIDIGQRVDRLPGPDQKIVAESVTVDVGGPAANAARVAAALGRPVTLLTALGDGPLARLARDLLQRDGVDVVDLASGGEVPVSTVLLVGGARSVVSTNAVGREVRLPDGGGATGGETPAGRATGDRSPGGVPPHGDLPDDVGPVLLDGHLVPAQVAVGTWARARGIPVVLDGGSWKAGLEDVLGVTDEAIVSADLAVPHELGGDRGTLEALHRLGPTWVARSAGPGPVAVLDATGGSGTQETIGAPDAGAPPPDGGGQARGEETAVGEPRRREEAVPRVEATDTLGAGDVLHGAYAAARAGGDGPDEALRVAIGVASESVRHPGVLGWVRPAPPPERRRERGGDG